MTNTTSKETKKQETSNAQPVAQSKATVPTPTEGQGQMKDFSDANSMFTMEFFIKSLLLNWQWFILSVFLCLCIGLIYIRYTPSIYEVDAEILVKDGDNKNMRGSNAIQTAANLGFMNNSDGFDNEIEILKSVTLAYGVVNDLKLYVDYKKEGRVTNAVVYNDTPFTVDMDSSSLNKLEGPIEIKVTHSGSTFNFDGRYYVKDEEYTFQREGTVPMVIALPVGRIIVMPHPRYLTLWDDDTYYEATISNPKKKAEQYAKSIDVSALSKTTTIAQLSMQDRVTKRAQDYLTDLAVVYNRQANEDKNQIAVRTEFFINDRLQKLNVELGSTDNAIQSYKSQKGLVDVTATAGLNMNNSNEAEKSLTEMGTQILLLQSVKDFMMEPGNKYKLLPSNVGITDAAATALITQYNKLVLERNNLLQTASELSPNVQVATQTLNDLTASIKRAVEQATQNLKIQQQALQSQYSKYSGMMSQTPQQERILTEIGRQQSVKEGLYLMLLQKREENSIELAATADKGKLIDEPEIIGLVQPKAAMVLALAIILGLGIPFLILVLQEIFRFRIEGHSDVETLTDLPLIADVAIANAKHKEKGDIVVHENKNSQMEEIFRGMRTNVQFMLGEGKKVIMLSSSTSGEGKTFIAANLAVSFALLGKKVLLIGLDIRRPRLSTLFELKNRNIGISMLLAKENPSEEEIKSQIQPSGITSNLDILTAGPVPPNPTELLSRPSLEVIFDTLRKDYDYILCDTAPVGLVTDTLHIARVVDATIIVCRADYTEKSAFFLFNEMAETGKLPNVAFVLNGIDMTKKKYGYAYGYGKYGKYGKYGRRTTSYRSNKRYQNYKQYTHAYEGYGGYGAYGTYGGYGAYGNYRGYGGYNNYGYHSYGYHSYGYKSYSSSKYSNPEDDSIKK